MNFQNYHKLYKIFSDKDWHSKKDHNNAVFTNFCNLLNHLTEQQQDLIIELTERYDWLSINEYNSELTKLFNSIPQQEINQLKKVYLLPIFRVNDSEITKSGHGILFMLRGIRPFLEKYSAVQFIEVEKYDFFTDNFKLNEGELVFLLDDFLGSGATLDETIKELLKKGISINHIRVLTIASHIQAIEYMKKQNIIFYTSLLTKKGISEYYEEDHVKVEKIEIMRQIEKILLSDKFNFGYSKSEALVTLYRTPNNTFPIFWMDHLKDEVRFKAPFSRY